MPKRAEKTAVSATLRRGRPLPGGSFVPRWTIIALLVTLGACGDNRVAQSDGAPAVGDANILATSDAQTPGDAAPADVSLTIGGCISSDDQECFGRGDDVHFLDLSSGSAEVSPIRSVQGVPMFVIILRTTGAGPQFQAEEIEDRPRVELRIADDQGNVVVSYEHRPAWSEIAPEGGQESQPLFAVLLADPEELHGATLEARATVTPLEGDPRVDDVTFVCGPLAVEPF